MDDPAERLNEVSMLMESLTLLDGGPPTQDVAHVVDGDSRADEMGQVPNLDAPDGLSGGPSTPTLLDPQPSFGLSLFGLGEGVPAVPSQSPPPLPSPSTIARRRRHLLPTTVKTYSRRSKIPATPDTHQLVEPGLDTPLVEWLQPRQPLSPEAEFISKLSKTPGGMLLFPAINKRRKKTRPSPCEATRRSRRVAKLPPSCTDECLPHLKKKVMRALDMDVSDGPQERMQFDQEVLDEYARRFRHPHATQVKALAALFGLTPPSAGVESDGCVV